LLEDEPRPLETGIDKGGADGPDAGGRHPRVGEDEREHAGPMIERACDHARQVVARGHLTHAMAQ
jgi:hypothetical protein